MYSGSGDPYDLAIYGDTMYYNQRYTSDGVFRIDIVNFTTKPTLDAGAQLSENGGDVYGMEIIGDVLHVSVASGQWWQTQGSGGIALYNLTTDSEQNYCQGGKQSNISHFFEWYRVDLWGKRKTEHSMLMELKWANGMIWIPYP